VLKHALNHVTTLVESKLAKLVRGPAGLLNCLVFAIKTRGLRQQNWGFIQLNHKKYGLDVSYRLCVNPKLWFVGKAT
jgi:hypothetical protein